MEGELVWTFPGTQLVCMREDSIQKSPFLMCVRTLLEQDEGRSAGVCLPSNVNLRTWLDFDAAAEAQRDCDRPYTDPEGLLQVILVRMHHVCLFRGSQGASATPGFAAHVERSVCVHSKATNSSCAEHSFRNKRARPFHVHACVSTNFLLTMERGCLLVVWRLPGG